MRRALSWALLVGIAGVTSRAAPPRAGVRAFANPAPIAIPEAGGVASPYPSNITVAGLAGTIVQITVTIANYSHTFPDDVAVLVTAPNNQSFMLMDGAGDGTDVSGATIAFSDFGSSILPDTGPVPSGTFKPTSYVAGFNFPPPGPGTTWANPGPAGGGTATLAGTFAGANPNGVWKLFVYDHQAIDGGSIAGGWSLTVTTTANTTTRFDWDADGKTDAAVVRSGQGGTVYEWYVRRSSDGGMSVYSWGSPSMDGFAEPGDYDGDGQTDVAVWRNLSGPPVLYVRPSTTGGFFAVQWGAPGDIPQVVGDYDGDGRADFGVFRGPAWYIRLSANGSMFAMNWGFGVDTPAQGDYDGDGRTDVAVQRNASGAGVFYVFQSAGGFLAFPWGFASDIPVIGDYDGDGKDDFAVARNAGGTKYFYANRSSDGALFDVAWGFDSDRLVPGDYDGDGRTDVAVWRPSIGTFFIRRSSDGGLTVIQWGQAGDYPVATAYLRPS
jgi:YD repeat-containing protein